VLAAEAGNRRLAMRTLAAVVSQASVEGHVRLFLDAGPIVARLLRNLPDVAPAAYVRHLVLLSTTAAGSAASGGLVALSERELDVVRYLATPLSSAEIAARLYISVNTLKTHLRAIYRKLAVSGRGAAVHRLEELGIA
jgi:LuxR family maltose regulon positive regulatory protein